MWDKDGFRGGEVVGYSCLWSEDCSWLVLFMGDFFLDFPPPPLIFLKGREGGGRRVWAQLPLLDYVFQRGGFHWGERCRR